MDRYRRVVAVCRVGSINLNAWMIENGWVVAYIRFSKDYVEDERILYKEYGVASL
jgi:endonuclease YncB( thermonuclease family)|tara:strand:+ start:54 stop:218 length:165 start_codon:yes stop_codon:yes gene_type:complete